MQTRPEKPTNHPQTQLGDAAEEEQWEPGPLEFPEAKEHLEIHVDAQELRVFRDGERITTYPISTSRHGLGSEEGSYRTPLGEFQVREKIGCDAPLGTIFKSRKVEGLWTGEPLDDDLVLTRILWLEGLEEGNANTFRRYIYIHGTNHEERIGVPESMGCVRMRNTDVTELYATISLGTRVSIIESVVEEEEKSA